MRILKKKRVRALLLLLAILLGIALFLKPYYTFATNTLQVSPIRSLFGYGDVKMLDGRVNILVLGIPGGNHDGPLLSDSMTVMSYNTNTNTAHSIGVPRDIWSSTMRDKINSAYAYGEAKVPGGGLRLAKAEVGAIIGVPIHYAVVIDFHEFVQLIDLLGGIDLTVENSFTDNKFPIEGEENNECDGDEDLKCRYTSVSFKEGPTTMDGKTALNFVRSRNAEGEEGSDFARNKRQQLVMGAIKEKIAHTVFQFNVKKLEALYASLNSLVKRDMTNQQAAYILRNIILSKHFKQTSTALPRELFTVPDFTDYDGKYVLVPEDPTFDEVHSFVRKYLALD